MPRRPRLEYPSAVYYVVHRGDRREEIFRDDLDRERFLPTLVEACGKTQWQVHADCLMSNEFKSVEWGWCLGSEELRRACAA